MSNPLRILTDPALRVEKIHHSYIDLPNGRLIYPEAGFGVFPTFPVPVFIARKPYVVPSLCILSERQVFSLVFDATQEDLEEMINDDEVCFERGLKKNGGKCWPRCSKRKHVLEIYKKLYQQRIENLPLPQFLKSKIYELHKKFFR